MIDKRACFLYNGSMSSIREVAREAGVSPATVSRSFVSPDLLNAETRRRVLAVAARLNYQPRRARPARTRPGRVAAPGDFLGFQFFGSAENDTAQANAFYAPVLAGAQAEAARLGSHLILHTVRLSRPSPEVPLMARTVSGMLLAGTGAAAPDILNALAGHVPVVLVDSHDPTGRCDCILSDGAGGAFASTQHLFSLGHRRVGFLLSERRVSTFRDRLEGYLGAHHEAGIPCDPALILSADSMEDTYTRLPAFLSAPARPTALLCANDLAASAVLQVCRVLGVDIPGDLSVIGFDDLELSSHTFPTLSTVRVDKEYLGRLAVRRLHARLHADPSLPPEPPLSLVLPTALILRQSCRSLQ